MRGSSRKKNIREKIACGLELSLNALAGLIGRWQVVWGPAVYQFPWSNCADNTIFAARSEDGKRYVIAVAGSLTCYDYMFENFPVWTAVPWPGYVYDQRWSENCGRPGCSIPCISTGIYMGLDLIKKIKGENKMLKKKTECTIYEFLKFLMEEHNRENVEIWLTGHSMGGALSGTLALEMFERREEWDPKQKAALKAQPVAAPPVGNKAFARYSDEKIGLQTTRIWNTKDPFVYAWNKKMMAEVPHLFEPQLKAGKCTREHIDNLTKMPFNNEYYHIKPDTAGLEGKFESYFLLDAVNWMGGVFNFFSFLMEALHQHVTAYFQLIGFGELFEFIRRDKLFRLPQISLRHPLFRSFGRRLSRVQERRLTIVMQG